MERYQARRRNQGPGPFGIPFFIKIYIPNPRKTFGNNNISKGNYIAS